MDESVDPRYDCDHCGPWNKKVRDLDRGCPNCPLTLTRQQLWTGPAARRGLYQEWDALIGEGDPRKEEPLLSYALSAVIDALSYLPEGQTAHPSWSPGFLALAQAYLSEVAYLRRIARWDLRQSMEE